MSMPLDRWVQIWWPVIVWTIVAIAATFTISFAVARHTRDQMDCRRICEPNPVAAAEPTKCQCKVTP